ncbi:MAG: excisionase [Deltaproteobacteria bacterium]|nr:MAG: excisionase [Deltaproteobacteria bacterium]
MRLEIKDVARMLDLPEATIARWIKQGKIPAKLERGRYIFEDRQLKAWARTHNITLREDKLHEQSNNEDDITLHDAMERGGVFFDVKGDNPEEVLKSAVALMDLPPSVDREVLLEKLLQREELSSTGIGEGVAIPHPRHPLESFPLKATVTTCFLEKEVDFNSVDGRLVFVIFVMLSRSTKIHLKLLSRLSFCLRNREFVHMLRSRPQPEQLLCKVKELEGQL